MKYTKHLFVIGLAVLTGVQCLYAQGEQDQDKALRRISRPSPVRPTLPVQTQQEPSTPQPKGLPPTQSSNAVLPQAGQPSAIPSRPMPPNMPPNMAPRIAPVEQPAPVAVDQPSEELQDLSFEGADLEIVMEMYCEWTGRTMLKTDAVKATISLKAKDLTREESLKAIEAVLTMNNIALIPVGEKFLKVVQANQPDLTGQGLNFTHSPELSFDQRDKLVTHIIQLKHVEFQEVQAAIQHLMNAFGRIQTLERNNSIMITDTASNMRRILELIDFVDQPAAKVEPKIYQLEYAEADQIAAKINEIVQLAQGDQRQPAAARRAPQGVIRARNARVPQPAAAAPSQATVSRTEGGSDLVIRGTVKVMSDERTNIIMIFSQAENFEFFDKIIKVFDVPVEPEISYEVVNLEYADAEEISSTLNELVGAAQNKKQGSSAGTSGSRQGARASGINTAVRQLRPISAAASQNLSQLSEKTKILADKRSNSLLLMGRKNDIAAIKEVIKSLDVMLEQVVIEAAIFEVGLNDTLDHGIQWLYESQDQLKAGGWDGVFSSNGFLSAAANSLTYGHNITGIDTKLAIKLAARDEDARLLATPVIMTTDNTEAVLSIGEQRPVVTSTDTFGQSSGTRRSSYEYKDIGIQLTVTPRINPQRFVVMEIKQKADQIGTIVTIDENEVPTILNREFEATITVPDRGTIALGGLITTEQSDTVNKIPILGDIPLLGKYLFSSRNKRDIQRELLVLMTPYVVTDADSMIQETERLYKATSLSPDDWDDNDWSDSKLRLIQDDDQEPVSE